jgi:DNA-binding transcriptional ArsR family regulator
MASSTTQDLLSKKRKAYSDPVRLRIIECLAAQGERTAKQLGEAVGVETNRLYYHLRILEGAELVKIGGAEATRTGAERIYSAATPYGAGNELPGVDPVERVLFFSSILDATKSEISDIVFEQARQTDAGEQPLAARMIRGALYGRHEAIDEFASRFAALLDEFNERARTAAADRPSSVLRFPLTFAVYELPASASSAG